MSTTDLVEQQITKHETHLKRIDELFDRARRSEEGGEAPDPLLESLAQERDQLAKLLSSMRHEPPDSWQEMAEKHFGPLAIWEAIARLLEHAIERLEKGSKEQ